MIETISESEIEELEGCDLVADTRATENLLHDPKETIKKLVAHYRANQWRDVKDELPPENEKVRFWLVLKPIEERMHDSSGNPIPDENATVKPYMYECKWLCWSSVMKPTHWMPLPTQPTSEEADVDRTHEECDDCALRDVTPAQCIGHAAGPFHCDSFKPTSEQGDSDG